MRKDENNIENVIILGAGPAGLAAALYTARAGLNPLILTGSEFGGQLSLTDRIENYPGFPQGVGGLELADLFQKHAEKFGARIEYEIALSVDLTNSPFLIKTYDKEYQTRTLIIATGASSKNLNIPGEKEFRGRGVSYCATCDGAFFKNKRVVVVGGGDSALEEGLFLTNYAAAVTIIHRRKELRASVLLRDRVKKNNKISFLFNTIVEEINGDRAVNSLRLRDIVTNSQMKQDADGIFICIGHIPNSDLFRNWLDLDKNGYLQVDNHTQTKIPGVFAAGEVADPSYRQVITSAGMGVSSAIEAIRFLQN